VLIALEIEHEARRLLRHGAGVTAVAGTLSLHRKTVRRIRDSDGDRPGPRLASRRRCPGCGGLLATPCDCLACATAAARRSRSAGDSDESCIVGLDLKPTHFARYAALVWRRLGIDTK